MTSHTHAATGEGEPDPTVPQVVRLRAVHEADIPALFAFERDAEANRLAGVHPRDERTFLARWRKTLSDRTAMSRAIVADGVLVGRIECFPVGDVLERG